MILPWKHYLGASVFTSQIDLAVTANENGCAKVNLTLPNVNLRFSVDSFFVFVFSFDFVLVILLLYLYCPPFTLIIFVQNLFFSNAKIS